MGRLTPTPPRRPDRLDLPFQDPLVGRLFPPLATGVDWGLSRMECALRLLGDPHLAVPVLHVGGTNGKGSVTATLAAVLERSGLRTGMYTSPHLCSFRERIVVGGAPVPEGRLTGYADEVRPVLSEAGLTFFEAATVLAFHAFRGEGVEVAVLEVGLGGRLDATNVVTPLVSLVTNIALDHAEYLGGTLPEIAREKAGIAKPACPFLTGETDPRILGVLREEAIARGARFVEPEGGGPEGVRVARDGTRFVLQTRSWGRLELHTPLVGAHQAGNTALAVRALELLPDGLRPGVEAVVDGVRSVRHPGRGQIERIGDRTWLFDVAHNPAGIRSLVETVQAISLERPRVALVGILGDKDVHGMLELLSGVVDGMILTQPPSVPKGRRWDPHQAPGFTRDGFVEVVEDFQEALEAAGHRAPGGTVVVTGSVHTVGSALSALGRAPWPE